MGPLVDVDKMATLQEREQKKEIGDGLLAGEVSDE